MKYQLAAVFLSIALLGATGCGDAEGAPASGHKTKVVATSAQIAALVDAIGGDDIELRGLVPAGADPHAFEPVASDLRALESADVVLRHGMGLDEWLDDTLKAAKNANVVAVTDGVSVRKSGEDGKVVDDPHVWLNPDNDKVMVANIADALGKTDPAHKVDYEANAAAYGQKLDDTKVAVQAIIDEIPPANRKMVTDHDAFGYFADAFGLTIVGAVFPVLSTQSEPSASQTAALLDTIRREGVKAIFTETSLNPRLSQTLANDAGVKIVDDLYGDSLGKPESGADTVDGMLLVNARKITDALK